ncbi:helix-turn-helix domain-containing protein [Aneurinibacillus uraniidurans]|uniref:helix-turn-helix domain-containing protein n=1 Tax=Aneurinibacillus uraniidurans TaxID=2966586 RepID=UPI0023497991|nr:XRE family transcriptional regulator [Aneurinibacillus sp. B1]WCN36199.1 XRE family transcriptional regulator [Aneurinibacillus sp. B1]
MHSINLNIGKNFKRIRTERNLSLDKMSELTGVSKAMLGQIERGESNPTITTIWKIASGLHISFSSLLAEDTPPVTLVDVRTIDPVIENDEKYRVYPLFPFHPKKQFEIFSLVLEPGGSHESEGHTTGVEEYVIVGSGTLEFVMEQEIYHVTQGSALHFQADRPHCYRNAGTSPVVCSVIIHYPH